MISNLFKGIPGSGVPANQYGPSFTKMTNLIGKGSLIRFNYTFVKPGHDQTPVVLVTDVWANYIRGVNIGYLTFPYVKRLLQQYCNSTGFSYANIKGQEYIVSAFRQYKRAGLRGLQKLDCAFLLNVLASVRSYDPHEIEAIRKSVRDQIRKLTNPTAQPTGEMPISGF